MGEISERQDAHDWTELEQGFFAAAPPDVAIEPPPAATFDDLFAAEPARKRPRRRARRVRHEEAPAVTRVGRAAGTLGRTIAGAARAAGHVVVWSIAQLVARAFTAARRLAPASRLTPEALRRGLRAMSARLAPELPERPDAKTLVAGIAALLVVFGVSASVLGSRGPRLTAETAAAEPAPPAAEPAPEAAPAPVAARPTMVLPPVELVAAPGPSAHHHRRHK